MASIMLRSFAASLSSERTPLPCIGDPLSGIGRASWTPSGTGKVKHSPESVRASPYPPLARSTQGFGSGAAAKRVGGQSLRRTASLHGGDSLASLQQADDSARHTCKPATKRRARPLRASPSFANTHPLDVLVCPPPAPPPRCDVHVPPPVFVPEPPQPPQFPPRRRSSLAPAPSAPTALVVPRPTHVPLPSPPALVCPKKKREPLAQRTLRRTFERTPRGAHVKVLGAHAAMRMLSEAEEEAAVAATVVVVEDSDDDACMSDSWVEVDRAQSPAEEMEWSMIDGDEC